MKISELINGIFKYIPTTWHNKVDDPEGDNSHPGTNFTAERANKIEKGIEKSHKRINNVVEYLKENDTAMKNMRFDFLLLKSSVTSGLTSNILVDNLDNLDSITLHKGAFDSEENKVYLP